MVMDALECPGIEMLEEVQKSIDDKSLQLIEADEVSDGNRNLRDLPDANEMIEFHIKESLKSGPITKFNGLNVIKMIGKDFRLFFGEKPKAIIVTFIIINIPATYFNVMIAGVSQ